MNILSTLSAAALKRAANLKEKIDLLEKELNSVFNLAPAKPVATKAKPGKRKMSAAGRARISAAAKARWAKAKAAGKKSL